MNCGRILANGSVDNGYGVSLERDGMRRGNACVVWLRHATKSALPPGANGLSAVRMSSKAREIAIAVAIFADRDDGQR